MITLYDGKANLRYAAKRLMLAWQETRNDWNDSVSSAFERDHLTPLEPQIGATLHAVERLADILRRAETDCREAT